MKTYAPNNTKTGEAKTDRNEDRNIQFYNISGRLQYTTRIMDRTMRQKANKEILKHGTFYRTNHILGNKTNLNKFQKKEMIQNMSFDPNGIELGISNRKILETHKYMEIKEHSPKQPTSKRNKKILK